MDGQRVCAGRFGCGIRTQEIERGRRCADDDQEPARLQKFSEFYQDPESSGTLVGSAARRPTRRPVCTAPIKYVGHAAIRADIENLKKAMASSGMGGPPPARRRP
jgi:hypothetical protein